MDCDSFNLESVDHHFDPNEFVNQQKEVRFSIYKEFDL